MTWTSVKVATDMPRIMIVYPACGAGLWCRYDGQRLMRVSALKPAKVALPPAPVLSNHAEFVRPFRQQAGKEHA